MTGNHISKQPVAIVGIAAIAPMAADTTQFWQNILNKVDAITEVPPSRWKIADYYDPDPTIPDKAYSKVGGFLPEIPFDPLEFGIPPNILEFIDTSQLLSLVVAKRVLADAGYLDASAEIRERTGVILGVGGGQTLINPLLSRLQYPILEQIFQSANLPQKQIDTLLQTFAKAYVPWEENAFPGLLGNVISGRITNRLDLGGINCVVDAACASSMSALKMAVSELQAGNTDMMITGGVDTDTSPFMYLSFSKTPALSKRGRSTPFDNSADGMLLGEAITMFCLKRLDDAKRDNDRIYAVIRGIGASSDGRAKSIYAPRASGQVIAMRRAYEEAGISPASVDLIEAHGTGTARGDATELESVATLLTDSNVMHQQVAIGSIKSQVGHTKAAAGGVSMAKIALALHHKILPPTINVETPNPTFTQPDMPLYVNTEARPWVRRGHPRRAGVSSFGFGGTNFHVVMEEYTPTTENNQPLPQRLHETPRIVIVHAESPSVLATTIHQHLNDETPLMDMEHRADAAPIPANHARIGFVAANDQEAQEKLRLAHDQLKQHPNEKGWELKAGIYYRREHATGKVVALFPGQGSQYLNMGRELLNQFPHLQSIIEQFDEAFPKHRLTEIVYPPPAFEANRKRAQSDKLTQTEYTQPALGAMSMMLYSLLRDAGFQPDTIAGHSFGELTALWAGGVLSDTDFIQLAIARGQAMKARPGTDTGQMAAVIGDTAALAAHLQAVEGVHIANDNSKRQAVIAGAQDKLDQIIPHLQNQGYRVIPLPVSAAFHTPLVSHAQQAFAQALDDVSLHAPQTDVYANSTAGCYPQATDGIQQLLMEHILNPVRFRDQIEAIYQDGGRIFVEIGARNVLTRLLQDNLQPGTYDAIALNADPKQDSDHQLREAVVKLMVLGIDLKNMDRYAPQTDNTPQKSSPLQVMLSGANYVSAKTRDAYEAQLQHNKTHSAQSTNVRPLQPTTEQQSKSAIPEPTNLEEKQTVPATSEATTSRPTSVIDTHLLFLEMQRDFNQRMTTLYLQVMERIPAQAALAQQLLNQVAQLQEQNQHVIQAHTLYMQSIAGHTHPSPNGHQAAAPTLPEPPTVTEETTNEDSLLAQFLQSTTQHQQQQPSKTNGLRLGYDMPSPPPATQPPAKPKTKNYTPVPVKAPVQSPPQPVTPVAQETTQDTLTELEDSPMLDKLLGIVSEKTGYPVDLLEAGMSLEADLGIDSIKRVEILGVMQDTIPGLPPLKPDEMAVLESLGEIADYIQGQMDTSSVPSAPKPQPTPPTAPSDVQPIMPPPTPKNPPPAMPSIPSADKPAQPTAEPAKPANNAGDTDEMLNTLLSIVSEKTGYPVDLLEPSMSLEADLGIDSIKRVEILGVMQDTVPGLPPLKPDEMAVLDTLGEIADYIQSQQTPNFSQGEGGIAPSSPADLGEVLTQNVVLARLPHPDRLMWMLPAGTVALVTDDGSALVDTLVNRLQAREWDVVRLALPGNPHPQTDYQLEYHTETMIEKVLEDITTHHGNIGVFIHVAPQADNREIVLGGTAKERAKLVFFLTKHLHASLHSTAQQGRAACMFVTRGDGQLGTTGTVNDVVNSGLSGFLKSVAAEWPQVVCRLVDVNAGDELATTQILAELDDPNTQHHEIGYMNGIRYTLSLEQRV